MTDAQCVETASQRRGEDDELQKAVLESYMRLAHERTSWTSKLVLLFGHAAPILPFAYAAPILGGLALSVGRDRMQLRTQQKRGAYDFLVNSPGEAVRIIKNEARLRRPVSVALAGLPEYELPMFAERGLSPALVLLPDDVSATELTDYEPIAIRISRSFHDTGATTWRISDVPEEGSADKYGGLRLECFDFENIESRRRFDEFVLGMFANTGHVSRAWIYSAARVLPRHLPLERYVYLTPQESAAIRLECLT